MNPSFKKGSCFGIIICLFFSTGQSQATYIDTTYDYKGQVENGGVIIPFSDTSFLIIGNTYNLNSNRDKFYLLHIDEAGDKIWEKDYGADAIYRNYVNSYIYRNKSRLLLAGSQLDTSGDAEGYILRINKQGDSLWSKTYGLGPKKDYMYEIIKTKDGNWLLAGASQNFPNNEVYIYLVKTDTKGNIIWERTYGEPYTFYKATSITQANNGDFIVCGYKNTDNYEYKYDIYYMRIDSTGKMLWEREIGKPKGNDKARDIIKTHDNNFLITGQKTKKGDSSDLGTYFPPYGWARKIDSAGNKLWEQYYGYYKDTFSHTLSDVVQRTDSSYVFIGGRKSYYRSVGWLLKTNRRGDSLWTRYYFRADSNRSDYFYDVCLTEKQGFIIVGTTYDDSTHQDVWILGPDSMGCNSPGCHITGLLDPKARDKSIISEVYPNPLHKKGTLKLPYKKPGYRQNNDFVVKIYNIDGQLLQNYQVGVNSVDNHSKIPIHAASLDAGIYLYKVSDEGKSLTTGKFIVE